QDYVRPEYQSSPGPASGPPPLLSLIDEYLYCDSNARLASAYLDAWWMLGQAECKHRAVGVLDLLWEKLRSPGVGMYHYWDGSPQVPGLLMDLVVTGAALLDAFACLETEVYLQRATGLAADLLENYRNSSGGFSDICSAGPASLQYPVTVLTQNASVASFLVRLADLSDNLDYRQEAHWALRKFPNSHRNYEAFAAGFGQALSRLLSLPLTVTITGTPGDPGAINLARAALTGLRHGDLVLRFRETSDDAGAKALVQVDGLEVTITDPQDLRPEVILNLSRDT
ncbi:MAG: hypothetical protein ACE5Q6_25920, partial [Dehalococcoidia bacterium]